MTPAGVVTTIAGLAKAYGNVDATGPDARFWLPFGVATSLSGNVYVADPYASTIRKISPDGVVTTLAGKEGATGTSDGPGPSARFDGPTGVAVDSAGNVYVADNGNDTVRKITPAGVVSTLAGDPTAPGASTDGTGSAARFYRPTSLATDPDGNIFVTEDGHTVRRVTPAGVVTTLAGLAGQLRKRRRARQRGAVRLPSGHCDGRLRKRLRRRHGQPHDPEDHARPAS